MTRCGAHTDQPLDEFTGACAECAATLVEMGWDDDSYITAYTVHRAVDAAGVEFWQVKNTHGDVEAERLYEENARRMCTDMNAAYNAMTYVLDL